MFVGGLAVEVGMCTSLTGENSELLGFLELLQIFPNIDRDIWTKVQAFLRSRNCGFRVLEGF